MAKKSKYPIIWSKDRILVKVYCSIPNVATGILLKAGDTLCVIDPGDGVLRDLNADLPVQQILQISDIFVSHGHHDHVGGVWSLLTYLRVMHKHTPVTIHYPAGCIEIETLFSAFKKVYALSLPYRIILHRISTPRGFTRTHIRVTPFPVIHEEQLIHKQGTKAVPALGFKFSYRGIAVCYGGDSAYCDTLVRMAKDSDLAILEAGHDDDIPDGMHMTAEQALAIGKSAKQFFLVHVPQ